MKKLLVLASVVMLCGTATGNWLPTEPDDYAVGENWGSGFVPGHPDHPTVIKNGWVSSYINNGGTAQLDSDVSQFDGVPTALKLLYVENASTLELLNGAIFKSTYGVRLGGDGGPGTMIVREGASMDNLFSVGYNGTEASVVEQYGSALNIAVNAGESGVGEYYLYGGEVLERANQNFYMGMNSTGNGLFVQHPGTRMRWNREGVIGKDGTGVYTMYGDQPASRSAPITGNGRAEFLRLTLHRQA